MTKLTKSKQIRAYKEANPTHKPSDVAKACGVTNAYVYQVLHSAKKKAKKLKLVVPTEGQETLRKEIKRLKVLLSHHNHQEIPSEYLQINIVDSDIKNLLVSYVKDSILNIIK